VYQYPEVVKWILWLSFVVDETVSTVAFFWQRMTKVWVNVTHQQSGIIHCLHERNTRLMSDKTAPFTNSFRLTAKFSGQPE